MNVKLSVVAMLLGLLVCGSANAGDAVRVTQVPESYLDAMNARDVAAAAALFQSNERVVAVVDGRVDVGVEAIRTHHDGWEAGPLEIRSVHGKRLGDGAYLLFATLGTAERSDAVEASAFLTLVLQRDDEGWKIAHQHASGPQFP